MCGSHTGGASSNWCRCGERFPPDPAEPRFGKRVPPLCRPCTVSRPGGANNNSNFCGAPDFNAIRPMDVWSPSGVRFAADDGNT
jgi:hypothetical protein